MKKEILFAVLTLLISPLKTIEISQGDFFSVNPKEAHTESYAESNKGSLVSFSDPINHIFESSLLDFDFQLLKKETPTILKTDNGLHSSYKTSENEIKFEIEVQNEGYSSLDIQFFGSNDLEQNFHLHFFKGNKIIYFSHTSKKEVLQMAKGKADENGVITQGISISTQANNNKTILNLKWKDKSGNIYPLSGTEIHYTQNTKENITYSGKDGVVVIPESYSNISPVITIFSKTKSAIITNQENFDSKPTLSSKDCHSYQFKINSSETDITIDMSTVFGKAIQISQAIYYYSEYYKNLSQQANIEEVNVCYPSNENDCSYSSKINLMRITKNTFGYDLESYESWDTIGHEYGHYVENKIGFAKRSNPTALDHYSGKNDIDKFGKLDGSQLAFYESWPTYFAISAQQSFPSFIKNKVKSVGNELYEAFNFSTSNYYSLNKIHDSEYSGDGCERTLMNIFFHLYDEAINEYDKFSLGDKYLWNIVTKYKPNTLNDFLAGLYNERINRDDLGLLLERTHVCATNISISNSPTLTTPPKITWTSPIWRTNNSNYFDLYFYSKDGTLLFHTGSKKTIYATFYTPSESEWKLILKSYGTDYYVIVRTYQEGNGLITGPYYSNTRSFKKPVIHETKSPLSLSSGFKYYENKASINPGNTLTFQFYFPYSCKYIIQTFGTDETRIDIRKNGKTIASDSNQKGYSGNAFIHTYLETETLYEITVQAYDEDDAIDTKLVIIPCDTDTNGTEAFDNFDNISTLHDDSSGIKTYSTNLHRYSSIIFVFEPQYVANYNIYIDSTADNFLYVLNPEHTELVQEGTDYNDDCSDDEYDPDYNASVTKTMTLGTKYLIILSQSNPASDYKESERACKVTITRRNS